MVVLSLLMTSGLIGLLTCSLSMMEVDLDPARRSVWSACFIANVVCSCDLPDLPLHSGYQTVDRYLAYHDELWLPESLPQVFVFGENGLPGFHKPRAALYYVAAAFLTGESGHPGFDKPCCCLKVYRRHFFMAKMTPAPLLPLVLPQTHFPSKTGTPGFD